MRHIEANYKLHDRLPDDIVIECNGVTESFVYVGFMSGTIRKADLKWHYDDSDYIEGYKYLTLKEVASQLKGINTLITVFIDDPLKGWILQYGNDGDFWVLYGETIGYA